MWAARAARARELAERYPAAREILLFYAQLAEWQGEVAGRQLSSPELLAGLTDLVRRLGPEALRRAAENLTCIPNLDSTPPLNFFGRAARQPYAARLSVEPATCISGEATAGGAGLRCPACDLLPQAGCLRPEGEGLALELVCSLCFTHWSYPRARCPACGESAEGRLVHYTAPEFAHLRLQACETCRAYVHLVDLSKDPSAIPEVDELAALPLDLWAQQQGYHKLQPNIAGV